MSAAPADAIYDVAVIGAGIHGAGVAQAAAAAGYDVVLLERAAVAAGTSSRSSKLVHGGLRYLETLQLRLVYEALAERRRLLRLAPDLVRLRPFFIPVYGHARRGPAWVRAGLSLYALLGGLGASVRYRRVPASRWGGLDGLRREGLRAVFQYWDGQTDDAALTRAVAGSAQRLGARVMTSAELRTGGREDDVWRLQYRDAEAGEAQCRARAVVNAAGPWANGVLERLGRVGRPVDLVQGTHLVLEGSLDRGIYYVEAPADGRAVFVIDWGAGRILLGTTETAYTGDPAAVAPLDSERAYLRETLAHYFPTLASAREVEAYAGLRVLPRGEGPHSRRPRETVLHGDAAGEGIVTIYGGKLTTYRATAQRVVRRLVPALPRRRRRADTRRLPLPAVSGD